MNKELLEVKLKADKKVIVETLNRIGIADKKRKILYPSCYFHEQDGKTFICHFKQMFLLSEKGDSYDNISEEDIFRRNAIVFCLKNWGLIEVDMEKIEPHDRFVFVLPHKNKAEWKIIHKFSMRATNDVN
jgi:hypothetical protein